MRKTSPLFINVHYKPHNYFTRTLQKRNRFPYKFIFFIGTLDSEIELNQQGFLKKRRIPDSVFIGIKMIPCSVFNIESRN